MLRSLSTASRQKYDALVKTVVAKTDVDLIIADQKENRLVRSEETNLGDLCADAYKNVLGADICVCQRRRYRVPSKKGNITYGDIIAVHPFGNMACVIEVTGQQILDALEFGSRNVGTGDEQAASCRFPWSELTAFIRTLSRR